jgi:hypothetical protein
MAGFWHEAFTQRKTVKPVSLASADGNIVHDLWGVPYEECLPVNSHIEYVVPKKILITKNPNYPSVGTPYTAENVSSTASLSLNPATDIIIITKPPVANFFTKNGTPIPFNTLGLCIATDEDEFYYYIRIRNLSNTSADLVWLEVRWDQNTATNNIQKSSCGGAFAPETPPSNSNTMAFTWFMENYINRQPVYSNDPGVNPNYPVYRIADGIKTVLCLSSETACKNRHERRRFSVSTGINNHVAQPAITGLQAFSLSENTFVGVSYTPTKSGRFYTQHELVFLNQTETLDAQRFSRNYLELTPIKLRTNLVYALSLGLGPNVRMLTAAKLGEEELATLSERADENLRRFVGGISGDVTLRVLKNRINIGTQVQYQQQAYELYDAGFEWRPFIKFNF